MLQLFHHQQAGSWIMTDTEARHLRTSPTRLCSFAPRLWPSLAGWPAFRPCQNKALPVATNWLNEGPWYVLRTYTSAVSAQVCTAPSHSSSCGSEVRNTGRRAATGPTVPYSE